MPDERTLFRGHPAVATVIGAVIFNILLVMVMAVALVFVWRKLPVSNLRYCTLILPLIPAAVLASKLIVLKFITYEITTERVRFTRGILSRRTDELELYRVKDTSLIEPFMLRLFGVGNILLVTNDATTPTIELKGIRNAGPVREQLRASIEECRVRKGARVMEME